MFEYQTAIESNYMYDQNVTATNLVAWLEDNCGVRGRDWHVFSPKFTGKTKKERMTRAIYGNIYVFEFNNNRHQILFELVWSHAIKIATTKRIDFVES